MNPAKAHGPWVKGANPQMNKGFLIFDIETRPVDLDDIKKRGIMPSFKAPSNYKDPDKIAAKEAEHETEVMSRAALDATLSEICAIGYMDSEDEIVECDTRDEVSMLTKFWDKCRYQVNSYGKIIGFNIVGFDLPYLIRRSWIKSVPICEGIKRGRYFNDSHVIDLAEIWRLGEKNTFISLDRLSRVLGTGEKSGSGKDFAALLSTDREAALKYLANDLELTARLAKRLGAIQ